MFKKTSLFIGLVFLSSLTFGEKATKQNNKTSKTNKTEISGSSSKLKQSLPESTAAPKILKKHRETIHLEWAGGISITESSAFLTPLTLEVQGLIMKHLNEEFRWLFQAGGVLLSTLKLEMGVFPVFQTGLKYHFSKDYYGSLKGGMIGIFPADRMWTGGLFVGSEVDNLIIEGGIQFFYPDDDLFDLGVFISIGSSIKKW